jgi:hypothetical protein
MGLIGIYLMSRIVYGRILHNAKAGEYVQVDLDNRTKEQKKKCRECGKKMKHKEEIEHEECYKCASWKYWRINE